MRRDAIANKRVRLAGERVEVCVYTYVYMIYTDLRIGYCRFKGAGLL